ncbi:hypothetical protein BX666DRAFT_2029326 [Dichotomocladium elegans]|nr:hypothetical protein BX666DRAFT_2029326 [Dichotomocladium elegans]
MLPFLPKLLLRENYHLGPLVFFKAAGYIAAAQETAIEQYKTLVRGMLHDEDPVRRHWAEDMASFDFLALRTEELQTYWLDLSVKEASTRNKSSTSTSTSIKHPKL